MAAPTASTKSAGVPASLASMQEERGAAVRAVQLAAILTANVQRRLASSETLSKDDASPVTVADCTLPFLTVLFGGRSASS